MHFGHDGVVEGVEEPRGVRDLVLGEDPKHVELGVGCEPQALLGGGHHAGHEGAVSQLVLQGLLVGPVGPLLDTPEVRVSLAQPRVENGHSDVSARHFQLPKDVGL